MELPKKRKEHRGVIFDLRCRLNDGSEVIVEMQNYSHRFFKTRANYYLYKLMDKHVPQRGECWKDMKQDIPPLIGIFIMGEDCEGLGKAVTRSAECDIDTGDVFWDRMRKYYISLPHVGEMFGYSSDQTSVQPSDQTSTQPSNPPSIKELWFNLFKNLGNMERIDERYFANADEGLRLLIKKANIAALSPKEYRQYEAYMKAYMDRGVKEDSLYRRGLKEGEANGIEKGMAKGRAEGVAEGLAKGRAEGREEGVAEGLAQAIRSMKDCGKTDEEIAAMLKMSVDYVQSVKA